MTVKLNSVLENDLTSLAILSAQRLIGVEPEITVVIPVFIDWPSTARCLESLLLCDSEIAIQIVVVDDASANGTLSELARLPGIDLVRNGQNLGLIHSSNRGAAIARGKYVLFLSNQAELMDGALRALHARMAADERVGIVGSKIVCPDGKLQQAGSIIWTDGTRFNYGKTDAHERPEYNYAREVDSVSEALLMIRAKLFFQVGGFDRRFVPNFYKEIDLCFAVRASGHRVVYEPASVVVYHEETSEPENSKEVERVSAASRYNFRRKWAVILRDDHELSDLRNVARAARRRAKPSVLMIDWCVPLYDQDAGSNRIKQLIDGFRRADVHVVFFPNDLKSTNPYTRELQENGVEVVYTVPGITGDWRELFRRTLECVDVVWISRPDLCGKYLPLVRRQSRLPVLYDTIDLHHLRLRRQAEHNGSVDAATWQDVERLEVSCATAADGTIVVSDHEASILRNAGAQEISIIPTIHDMEPQSERCYERTDGILFIGGYAHAPNVDAVQWLIKDIMPIVWGQLPNVVVTLLGSNPPDAVRELAGSLVIVPGYLHDVSGYFKKTRIFVAPLRFGAGVKGKIGQALGHRIPLVTTAIGAEGFDLVDGVHAILAADTSTFASAMVRLYRDSDLWAKLALAADCALEPFSSKRVVGNALAEIHRIIELNRTT